MPCYGKYPSCGSACEQSHPVALFEGAARIELAVLRLGGPLRAYEFHRRLFERRGIIDSQKVGGSRGLGRAAE